MSAPPKGKSLAIIAYITFIGMMISFIMNREPKHEFASFHIKNMLGLVILLFIAQAMQTYIDLFAGEIVHYISFLLWAYSLVMAITNQQKGIPFLGDKFKLWFRFLD